MASSSCLPVLKENKDAPASPGGVRLSKMSQKAVLTVKNCLRCYFFSFLDIKNVEVIRSKKV